MNLINTFARTGTQRLEMVAWWTALLVLILAAVIMLGAWN